MSKNPAGDFSTEEREALAIITEESGELTQAIGKLLRHGRLAKDKSVTPPVLYDNLANLQKEVVDVMAAMMLLEHVGLIDMRSETSNEMLRAKVDQLTLRFHYVDPVPWTAFAQEITE